MNKRIVGIAAGGGLAVAIISGGVGYALATDTAPGGPGAHVYGPGNDDARGYGQGGMMGGPGGMMRGYGASSQGSPGYGPGGMMGGYGPGVDAAALADGDANAADTAALVFMIQEEKLAHDLYVALGDAWGTRVFDQIAGAETQHTSSIRALLDAYGIDDPTVGLAAGEFADSSLQHLYDTLLAKGLTSEQDALEVAGLVEETDIADLRERAADEDAITVVFDRLESASEHHLRAFAVNLEQLGVTYNAQVLDASEVDAIVGR